MKNLEIVSTTTNVQGKEDINGNTVTYSYNFVEGTKPLAIVFNCQRAGGTLSGTFYTDTKRFDVSNTKYQNGDAALTEAIFARCEDIVKEDNNK